MPAWFTRARHPELPPVVMPLAAVGSYPDWVAYGDRSADPDALNAALFAESRAASDPAFAPPAVQAKPPVPAPPSASAPVPSAPAGAAPKE